MLLQLNIRNIAIIDQVSLELGEGLNILTGETGAGKSIIIDSINAILGERTSREIIRTGKDKASVDAVFKIENERFSDVFEQTGIEPENDGTLVISREFSLSGRNLCRINGRMATTGMVRVFGERLVDIHGQHDNQSLLRTESHIELLDAFGGSKILSTRQKYCEKLLEYKNHLLKLKALSGDSGERERRMDLLAFQTEEIRKAKLRSEEENELLKQREMLVNSERITEALGFARDSLFSGEIVKNAAEDRLQEAYSAIKPVVAVDSDLETLSEKIVEMTYQLDDIKDSMRKLFDKIEDNPGLLEEVGARLDLISKLKRKYGKTVQDIAEYCEKAEIELSELRESESTISMLLEQKQKTGEILFAFAEELSAIRVKTAELLEEKIIAELEALDMKKARFKVDIKFEHNLNGKNVFGQTGMDKIEFLISLNAGEPLKPLSKIASGGEMARIMLAIKTILADSDSIPTLIFDEIDMGISGRTANRVGEKLAFISDTHQVICVTHLPQIASMADCHYLIEKFSTDNVTSTTVKTLSDGEKALEIARMVSGDKTSETSVKYADELLTQAKKFKLSTIQERA